MEDQFLYFQVVGIVILLLLLTVFLSIKCFDSQCFKLAPNSDELPLISRSEEADDNHEVQVTTEKSSVDLDHTLSVPCTTAIDKATDTEQQMPLQQPLEFINDHANDTEDEPRAKADDMPQCKSTPTNFLDFSQTCHGWLTSDKDFQAVYNVIWPARSKWYSIGVQLGLKMNDLNAIRKRHNKDPDECIIDMIGKWLNKEGAIWTKLSSALRHETVDYLQVANSLDHRLEIDSLGNSATSTSLASSTVSPMAKTSTSQYIEPSSDDEQGFYTSDSDSTDPSFKYLDTRKLTSSEKRTLIGRLRKETRDIMTHFANLVVNMRKSFKEREIGSQDLATTVQGIATREWLTSPLQNTLVDKDFTSVDEFVRHLQGENYISFINYHIVEYMITHHGSKQDKRSLHDYEKKFKEYCKRSVFEVPQDVFGPVPCDGEKFAFKIKGKRVDFLPHDCTTAEEDDISADDYPTLEKSAQKMNLSLGEALFILEKVSDALNLNIGSLVLLGVSNGCVEVTISVPKAIIDEVQAHFEETKSFLGDSLKSRFTKLETEGIRILCGPPGKPHVNLTSDNINLQWTKPKCRGLHVIQCYKIQYRSVRDTPKIWRTLVETEGDVAFTCVSIPSEIHLQDQTKLYFKIQAITEVGNGISSEISDPVILQQPCVGYNQSRICRSYSARHYRSKYEQSLTIDDLQHVLNNLNAAREKWYQIGLQLGLNVKALDDIAKSGSNSNTRLKCMLRIWLSQGGASWEALLKALQSRSVGYYTLSNKIAQTRISSTRVGRSYTLAVISNTGL